MMIEVTERAAEELRGAIAAEGDAAERTAVRVAVEVRHGKQSHSLELDAEWSEPDDVVTESRGICLVHRARDAGLLRGTLIDFCDDARGRGFTFERSSRAPDAASTGAHDPPEEQAVREALRRVIDPEVGLNIVDLGLVYGIEVDGRSVSVDLTMTTPACPLSAQIEQDAKSSVYERCPGASEVEINLVWSPPWSPELMSEEAKQQLGW